MNLSISNIAWSPEHDEEMYRFLQSQGFSGLEIAPTRIFPENPYGHLAEAREFAHRIKTQFGLAICSMQSIWYGMTQNIFGADGDRQALIDHTKRAIDFAAVLGCGNLVFGCPKNRRIPSADCLPVAHAFFKAIGDYAAEHHAVVALEPNPPYYNTNFINTTREAFDFCRKVQSRGLKVNVDLGTCIHYGERVGFLNENIDIVNHIHISEPMLAPIEKRELHAELKNLDFNRYFSIEMINQNDLEAVKEKVRYIKEVFA
jgi:sugar phosphate isomerase/epimerase